MKNRMKALLVAGVLGVSATACMTHADFNGVTYGSGTITITHDGKSITMMDKNLGADVAGTGASSYGDHYQWGGTTGYARTLSSGDAIAAGFNPDWTSEGWTKETDPCPDGYHVPTSQEWIDVIAMYTGAGNDKLTFVDAFKLPFAGYRNTSLSSVSSKSSDALYWSSTAYSADGAYSLYADSSTLDPQYWDNRARGFALRCFRDSGSSTSDLSAETEIILTIEEGQLSIGTDGEESVTLSGGMAASFESKTITKSLEKLFRVEDLKGSSKGYRTTISVTDMTGSVEDVVYTIPAENIYIKTTGLEIESGTGEDVVLTSSLSDFQSMEEPVTFIQRGTGTTAGLLGKYGARPELKVVVPANMPGTTYKGTITYTLYENE